MNQLSLLSDVAVWDWLAGLLAAFGVGVCFCVGASLAWAAGYEIGRAIFGWEAEE